MTRLAIITAAALAAAPAACGDDDKKRPAAPDDAGAAKASDAAAIDADVPPTAAPLVPGDGDEEAALAEAGAVGAWDAVVDRGRYLARRDLAGVIHGRLLSRDGGQGVLYDERIADPALTVRVAFDPRLAIEPGDRIAVWGAWKVDEERAWYWDATRVATLPATDAPLPDAPVGHQVATIDAPPEGAVPVSEVDKGGTILFDVVRTPVKQGEGWLIADPGENKGIAILHLPGDDASYGDQDYRTSDERWHLRRKRTYVVELRGWRIRPRRYRGTPIYHAVSAPRRVDAAAGAAGD